MDKNREAARSASRFPVVRHKERRMLVEPFRIWQLSPRVVRISDGSIIDDHTQEVDWL